jgi:hypothetical protein
MDVKVLALLHQALSFEDDISNQFPFFNKSLKFDDKIHVMNFDILVIFFLFGKNIE